MNVSRRFVMAGTVLAATLASGCKPQGPAHDTASPDGSTPDPPAPAGPEVPGWIESSINGTECAHPAVVAECNAGWCKVPAGCFIMGSPESELWRGENTEVPTAVTLSHAFEIGQRELTWQAWREVLPVVPTKPPAVIEEPTTCSDPQCPLRYATWFEALGFANALSARHEPPLAPCYELNGCTGDLGAGMVCTDVSLTAPSVYACEGYRLPTEAEWEYAARAGTRSAYYSGDISTSDVAAEYEAEPHLESVAWYHSNAGSSTHAVGSMRPNRWMLFDMLGNVSEWTSDQVTFAADPTGPLTDPATDIALTTKYPTDNRVTKGSDAAGPHSALRAASRNYSPSNIATQGIGFRLVRTLP